MHEFSLCQALIEQVEEELHQSGQHGRVLNVEVAVGRLSGVNPDSLRFAFEVLTDDTILCGATMNVTRPAATCYCGSCDARVEIDALVVECPRCRSADIVIEGGRDLLLASIEIEVQ